MVKKPKSADLQDMAVRISRRRARMIFLATSVTTVLVLVAMGAMYWSLRSLNDDVKASIRALDTQAKVLKEQTANIETLAMRIDANQEANRNEARRHTATLIAYNECIVLLGVGPGDPTLRELRACAGRARRAGRRSVAITEEDESRTDPDEQRANNGVPPPRPPRPEPPEPRPSPRPSPSPIICLPEPVGCVE